MARANRLNPAMTIAVARFSSVKSQSIGSAVIRCDDDRLVEYLHTLKSGKQESRKQGWHRNMTAKCVSRIECEGRIRLVLTAAAYFDAG
jgi:hypothetical protein